MTTIMMPRVCEVEVTVLEHATSPANMEALFESGVVTFRSMFFEIEFGNTEIAVQRLIVNQHGALDNDKLLMSGSRRGMEHNYKEFIDYCWFMTRPEQPSMRTFEEYRAQIARGTAIRFTDGSMQKLDMLIPEDIAEDGLDQL